MSLSGGADGYSDRLSDLIKRQSLDRCELEVRHAEQLLAWHEEFDPNFLEHYQQVVRAKRRTLDYWRAEIASSEAEK